MKVELKELPKSEIQITIELETEELEAHEMQAAKMISENVEIAGFRKGQAPKAFVISHVGPETFFQETLNVALPRSYFDTVKEKTLQVIWRPNVKVLSKSPLKYEAVVAVLPEITLKGVEKISIPQEPIEVSDKEIDEVVSQMLKYRATYQPLAREVQKGDRLEIDFEGFDEGGAALDKTKSTSHPLFVDEGSLVPGFEEQLLGMKVGDKKKFPVKFPKDFHHEPLRSKTVHFDVHVKVGEQPILPELNEEFVTQVMGEKKTVPEMRVAIKQDIHARKTLDSRRSRENTLLEKLLKEAKLDVPPTLMEEEVDYMITDLKQELESRKLTLETYMEKMKAEKRDIRKEYAPEAEKRIRVRLILNHLFRTLAIQVSDEEMARAGEKLIQGTPTAEKDNVTKQLASKTEAYLRLKNNMMLEKLFVRFLG